MFQVEAVNVQCQSQQLADNAEEKDVEKKCQQVVFFGCMKGQVAQHPSPARNQQGHHKPDAEHQINHPEPALDLVVASRFGSIWLRIGTGQAHGCVCGTLNSSAMSFAGCAPGLRIDWVTGSIHAVWPAARCIELSGLFFVFCFKFISVTATARYGPAWVCSPMVPPGGKVTAMAVHCSASNTFCTVAQDSFPAVHGTGISQPSVQGRTPVEALSNSIVMLWNG